MKTTKLIASLTFCGFAALLSCDNGASQTSGNLTDDDCPLGTFKPQGHPDCVFPADDQFGNPLGVSDNRCASGQPAFPPVCESDQGARRYFAASMDCAPNYHYLPGACQRGVSTGTGAAGVTGFAGTGFAGDPGFAGSTGAAGSFDPAGGGMTGSAGAGVTTGVGTGAAGMGASGI